MEKKIISRNKSTNQGEQSKDNTVLYLWNKEIDRIEKYTNYVNKIMARGKGDKGMFLNLAIKQ